MKNLFTYSGYFILFIFMYNTFETHAQSINTVTSVPAFPLGKNAEIISTISVASNASTAGDIVVYVDITNTKAGALYIQLEAPDGTMVPLMNRPVNGSGSCYTPTIKVYFQSVGGHPNIQTTCNMPSVTGTYKPAGSLQAFQNVPVNGEWKLHIFNYGSVITGILNEWSITFPAPAVGFQHEKYFRIDNGQCVTNIDYQLPVIDKEHPFPPTNIQGFQKLGSLEGSTFYLSANTADPSTAYNLAHTNNGYVATVKNSSVNTFLTNEMASHNLTDVLIGYNDVVSEGNFVWDSGSSSTYTNWGWGEPNNQNNEDYTVLRFNGFWNDIPDTYNFNFFMEIPGESVKRIKGINSGISVPVGIYPVVFEGKKENGDNFRYIMKIVAYDDQAPVISNCISDTIVSSVFNTPVQFTYNQPTATDNCSFNLIKNGRAEDGFNHWDVPYPQEWQVNEMMQFQTSFHVADKSQMIDLIQMGYKPSDLDTSPEITVSDEYTGSPVNYNDVYWAEIELLDANQQVIASYDSGDLVAADYTQYFTYTFSNYPSGLRYIRFTHGGHDAESWIGFYGILIDNTKITIDLPIPSLQTAGLPPGSTFPYGTTTNTFELRDSEGNISVCSFNVTVIDNEPPVAACQNTIVYLDQNGNGTVSFQAIDNGSSDNSSIDNYNLDITSFSCADLGNNTVTLTVYDPEGNSDSCMSTVTVMDTISPQISCINFLDVSIPDGQTAYTLPDFSNTAIVTVTENCNFTVTQSPAPGTQLASGSYTVTFHVTDTSGNQAQCSFQLNVSDNLTVGIDHLQKLVNLYPNPAEDYISMDAEGLKINKIIISDITGRVFLQQIKHFKRLPVKKLAIGRYFIFIHTDKGIIVKSFIKK